MKKLINIIGGISFILAVIIIFANGMKQLPGIVYICFGLFIVAIVVNKLIKE